ncbi:hypothetical protein HGRIS_010798 [Hohenbuehelia grisea]|uniref:Uncharacterized protein n=1 Tax=Hohenbuehelia grisea TaxID=104357 RepID=A0ABR3IY40_9AGAR
MDFSWSGSKPSWKSPWSTCKHSPQENHGPSMRQGFMSPNGTPKSRRKALHSTLLEISHSLESLHNATGVHSFFVAVDSADSLDSGFLGGTTVGRDFWRGLRHGGDAGAKAFKLQCSKAHDGPESDCVSSTISVSSLPTSATSSSKGGPSGAIKSELYTTIRNALRSTSGAQNAEMKWTNHDRLSAYGVKLVGWPSDIPTQNPSTLNAGQNKRLLELLHTGSMRFMPLHLSTEAAVTSAVHGSRTPTTDHSQDAVDEVLSFMRHDPDEETCPSTSNSHPRSKALSQPSFIFRHSPLSGNLADPEDSAPRKRLRTDTDQ